MDSILIFDLFVLLTFKINPNARGQNPFFLQIRPEVVISSYNANSISTLLEPKTSGGGCSPLPLEKTFICKNGLVNCNICFAQQFLFFVVILRMQRIINIKVENSFDEIWGTSSKKSQHQG